MLFHLRDPLSKNLQLICLLVLTQILFLNIASGQQESAGKATGKRQTSGKKNKPKVEITKRELILVRSPAVETPEDLEFTIIFNPCKGEAPGNVLGVSEQSKVADRVAAFVAKLGEPDLKTRACAARQLGYIGPEATAALPDLIRLMHDETNHGVWRHVEGALWAIGPTRIDPGLKDSKSYLADLVELSRTPDVYVRLYATFTLGYYKPLNNQRVIVEALISGTKDQDGIVRWMALKGLNRLGPIARDAVPALIQVLQTKNKGSQVQATLALGSIGPEATAAVPVLLNQLYGDDYDLTLFAAITLGQIGPVILPLLEAEINTHPFQILKVLEHLGPSGAPVVIAALRMQNKEVRKEAIEVAGSLGAAAEPAVPLLADALKDQDENIRDAAANALGHLGPLARTAVPALTAALNNKASWTQCTAARALGTIGPDAKSAVPDLVRLMNLPIRNNNDVPQRCAAEGLIKMSLETKALVAADMIKRIEAYQSNSSFSSPLFQPDETRPKPKPKPKETPLEIH
jgi:HEAT repeat protein